jgi:hypothetical protein
MLIFKQTDIVSSIQHFSLLKYGSALKMRILSLVIYLFIHFPFIHSFDENDMRTSRKKISEK